MKKNVLKNQLILAIIVIFGIVAFISCEKDSENKNHSGNQTFAQSEMNEDFSNLAIVMSKALNEDKNFRKIIKKEALLKFDGDYDILLKQLKDEPIYSSNFKSSLTIGKYLTNYSKELNIKSKSNLKSTTQDYIDQLTQKYPNLQISVPVHAEDWDDNYVPVVTFIPEEYDEKTTLTVVGYKNTNEVTVDAINKPNNPVIVIAESERINNHSGGGGIHEGPSANINCSGIQTESGIRIHWTISNVQGTILGYHVYRKGNGTTNFVRIGNSVGVYNMTYDDGEVVSLKSYSYYIQAFNAFGASAASNIVNVTAPDRPQAVESFDAKLYLSDDLELRWAHPAGQYIESTKIYKRVIGVDNDYNLLGTFNPNTHYYIDNNLTSGKQIVYKINEINNLGVSNPKFDFAVIPYRDISIYSPIYIKDISFNYDEIFKFEHWLRGAPEFKISVVKANSNGTTTVINDRTYCDFSRRTSFCAFSNKLISNWLPSDWMEVYTFKVYEYDGGPKIGVKINASYKTKNSDKTGYGAGGSVDIKMDDIFDERDDYIGEATLEYISPTTTHVCFSDYNFKIKISDKDN